MKGKHGTDFIFPKGPYLKDKYTFTGYNLYSKTREKWLYNVDGQYKWLSEEDGKDLEGTEILGNNAEFEKNGKQIFVSGDPQYYLNPELPQNGVLEIHGKIKVMPEEETFVYYRKILGVMLKKWVQTNGY